MATLTIKIESEELAREVLAHLNYLPDPDLVSVVEPEEPVDNEVINEEPVDNEVIDEEPVPKKELTNQEVFAFLRSKGMTLESACKQDPEFGDFIASFTTAPEKRINGDIEPADLTSLGTDIADLDNPEDRFNVENSNPNATISGIENAKEKLREQIVKLGTGNDRAPYDYLVSVSKHDQSLIVREAARALLIAMPKPKTEPPVPSYDSDSDGDEEIRKLARERAKEEREALVAEKDKIRTQAISIESENDRFNYILSNHGNSSRVIRNASLEIAFEFLANRNLDPMWIKQFAVHTPHLVEKLYQYKESDFIIKFKKENGI